MAYAGRRCGRRAARIGKNLKNQPERHQNVIKFALGVTNKSSSNLYPCKPRIATCSSSLPGGGRVHLAIDGLDSGVETSAEPRQAAATRKKAKYMTMDVSIPATPDYTMGFGEGAVDHLGRATAESHARHLLPHLRSGLRVLDFGCGAGTISTRRHHLVPGNDLRDWPRP